MASVDKHRGRWRIRYRGADGARHELSLPKGTPKAEAEKRAARIELREIDIREGVKAAPSLETVASAAKRYLSAIEAQRSWKSTESRWRLHILPALGELPAQQARPTQIEALLSALKKKGLGQQSCRHIRVTLSAFYEWLKKDGAVDSNPVDRVKAIPVPPGSPKALTVEQVEALAKAAEEGAGNLSEAILLWFYTSVRPGELMAATFEGVSLFRNAEGQLVGDLRIERTEGSTTTKTGKGRTVALGPAAAELLLEMMAARRRALGLGPTEPLRGPILLNAEGKPMKLRQAARALKTALKRAGLVERWEAVCRRCKLVDTRKPKEGEKCGRCGFKLMARAVPLEGVSLKTMRSTGITYAYEHGGAELAQEIAGHADLSTTKRHYVAVSKPWVRDGVARLFPSRRKEEEPEPEQPPPTHH